ncbi:MAG: GNAT family N-acetyltransferase [Melioribacteraceae bacterium]|nr:GNAT family N-acetyltransferase [Melioribacteraceae bacterium]
MKLEIRNFHPTDINMLYKICLQTGNSGKDATALFKDPDLLGHYYMAPYVNYQPELCFVVASNDKPFGYIIGVSDSEKFSEWCEINWFPVLRNKYPIGVISDSSFDAKIIGKIHEGYIVREEYRAYPAHLHIDLLPETQGQGMGRKLIEIFTCKLKELEVTALHLEVGKKNEGAIKFYEKVGFSIIKEYEYSIGFGKYI